MTFHVGHANKKKSKSEVQKKNGPNFDSTFQNFLLRPVQICGPIFGPVFGARFWKPKKAILYILGRARACFGTRQATPGEAEMVPISGPISGPRIPTRKHIPGALCRTLSQGAQRVFQARHCPLEIASPKTPLPGVPRALCPVPGPAAPLRCVVLQRQTHDPTSGAESGQEPAELGNPWF